MSVPDRAGLWRLTDHSGEVIEFDVYPLPNGMLCGWCEDLGLDLSVSEFWDTDEWLGHVPVVLMREYGRFEFIAAEEIENSVSDPLLFNFED